MTALAFPPAAFDGDDDQEPQQQTDPGSELKRIARQYGAAAPPRPPGAVTTADPGAELKRIAAQYQPPSAAPSAPDNADPGKPPPPLKAVGDIDLRDRGPSITTLEGLFHGAMQPISPAPALSVRVPEITQPNGLPQLARRNNNPGNLRFAGQTGAQEGDSGFAKFSSPEDGYRALLNQIDVDTNRGHTLTSFIGKFAPPDQNDTAAYIANMADALGVQPDAPLSTLDKTKLAKAIVQHESGSSVTTAPGVNAPTVPAPFSSDLHPEESNVAQGLARPKPIGSLAASDATRVGAEPSAHYQPNLLERAATFPIQMAIGAVQHPIDFAMAPLNAALTANRASAEQDAENAIAMNGGPIGSVERTVSPKDAMIASAQLAAMGAGPIAGEAGEAIGSAASRMFGGAASEVAPVVGHVAGHMVGAGAAGAAFDPNDPLAGALGMMMMSLPYGALAETGSRAIDAGRTQVANVIDQVRQASADARAQASAAGRADAQQAIARAISTLTPTDIAYIKSDPILGPLSRDVMPGQPTGMTPDDLAAANARLRSSPPAEPEQTLADALGKSAPSIKPQSTTPTVPEPAQPTVQATPPAQQPEWLRGEIDRLLANGDRLGLRASAESAAQRGATAAEWMSSVSDASTLGDDAKSYYRAVRGKLGLDPGEAGQPSTTTSPPLPAATTAGDELHRLAQQATQGHAPPSGVASTPTVRWDNPYDLKVQNLNDADLAQMHSTVEARYNAAEPGSHAQEVLHRDLLDLANEIAGRQRADQNRTVAGPDDFHSFKESRTSVEPNTGEHADSRPWRVGDVLFADRGNAEAYARQQIAQRPLPEQSPEAAPPVIELPGKTAEKTAGGVLAPGEELKQLAQQHGQPNNESLNGALTEIPSVRGRETRVLLRDGQELPAEYRVISSTDVRSSHDPFSFTPTPEYPEGVQGRDYQRNKAAQQAVAQRSLEFNPKIALNPSESAGEGVPTILPNGTVLAGNERSMLPRRAAVQSPERYQAYVDQLKARAADYGLDPATIDAVHRPLLVRTLTDARDVNGGPARWAEINRLSDEVATKSKSAAEEGAARASKLTNATDALDHLAATLQPEQTVPEYLGTSDGKTFVRKLVTDGVITSSELSRLTDASGALTEDGRLAVRRMLLSTAVTDPAALLDAPASVTSKIEHAVPSIVSTRGTPFDIADATTDALKMIAEARSNGLTVRDLESQGSLLGDVIRPPHVTALAEFLDGSKPNAVKAAYRQYATFAREALGRSETTDMFGGSRLDTPMEAFNEAFGVDQRDGPTRAPTLSPTASDRLYAEIPIERRQPGQAPTRAGQLLAEARGPRDTNAGPALGSEPEVPTPDIAVRSVNPFIDSLRKIFAATSRGEEAFKAGLTVREHDAALVHRYEQAKTALMDFAKVMDRMPVRDQLDFIDRIETGRAQVSPELDQLAQTIRTLLDSARDDIQALGEGQLEHWIENYFPHIWADPARAKSVIGAIMGKRSLTGPGSFLKKRAIPTVAEGIEAGLTPVTYNPLDLTLLKLREMHRYLAGQRILTELKGAEQLKFVNSFSKAPDGYQQINDKISTVYGPPRVTVVEAFDHMVRQGLENVMAEMGINHTRTPNIGGGRDGGVRLGFAQGDSKIVSRSATPESVIEHELGHALDARLGLWQRLHDYGDPTTKAAVAYRRTVTQELRDLADLRHEGIEDVDPNQHRYVRSQPEKVANAVMGLIYAPERMREVAPTVYGRLREILKQDPTTAKILDIKPSFRHGADTFDVPTDGQVVLGHWYAPEPVAHVVNNYLSPGLSSAAIGPYFDVYRRAGNLLNMAQLGMSAYHLGFTSLDAIVSRNALGLLQLREGHPVDAARSFASSPLAPVTGAMKGFQVKRAYLRGTTDPVLAQMVDGLEAAGGRVKMDEFYGGGAWRNAKLALHEGRYGEGVAKLAPAAIEQSTAWLMQHVVPWQKLGVFYDLAQHEMAKLPPGADRMQVREVMARAWDSVENRMGQLTYSNLFWHRWLKDGLMASVRSVGWNVGTLREIPGGIADLARSPMQNASGQRFALTPKASYVVALPVTVALLGGIIHYLYTGQAPAQTKDFFYPRTGRKNGDGSDERVQLPSYMRDVFDYTHAAVQTVKNKVNPFATMISDMLSNRDFYGNEIQNPDDPLVKRAAQEAHFVANQFVPFGVRNTMTQLHQGQSLGTAAQNFVGVTPAPRTVVRSDAQNRMSELLARRGGGTATPEEVDQRSQLRDVKTALRKDLSTGSAPGDALRQLADQFTTGAISRRQGQQTIAAAKVSSDVEQFKRLTAPEAIDVFQRGIASEKDRWYPYLLQKLRNARSAGQAVTIPPGVIR